MLDQIKTAINKIMPVGKSNSKKKPSGKPRPNQSQSAQQLDREKALRQAQQFAKGVIDIRDIVAPSGIEIDFNDVRIGSTYYRTYFIAGYPREVGPNWLSPMINFNHALDISMFYYPIDARQVLSNLRRKITEMQTELNIEYKEGKILDPEVQLSLQDAKSLQDELVAERERFFQFALYLTIPAETKEELRSICKQVESTLAGILLLPRKATLQMEDGFKSTIPIHNDMLKVYRNMDTTSIATTFPFTSSSLTTDRGIMYGINEHNGSLIIFDRFLMENANSVIFGKSGSGKSYAVKIEALRYLLMGSEIMIIDPENEFRTLCDVIGGEYITYDFNSSARINPFDLAQVYEEGVDQLEQKILVLDSLMKVMLGELSPVHEAILDRALIETYRLKGITSDPETQKREPPLMEDLYKVLLGMEDEEARQISSQLERYVMGSAHGLFDQPTNVDIKNTFTVFGIRDLEESIRPIGMFLILDYIWTRVRRDRRRRILYVDEAWIMMKHKDSAAFLQAMAKRARKYYLGVTTISQDIQDFLNSEEGLAIVTNSSIQVLMKQSATAIDNLANVFYLSEGEQNLLLSANVGEGLFFAGESHVAMQIVASPKEHQLVTTNPAELEMMEKMQEREGAEDKIRQLQETGVSAISEEETDPEAIN
jgi:type IV secretory pathway VirB4 component